MISVAREDSTDTTVSRIEVIQETADPAYLPVGSGQIVNRQVGLTGHGVLIRPSSNNNEQVFANFRLLCYTADGR